VFSSDEEALEAVKQWWKDNGAFVVAGLVIGVALIGGWRFWQASQDSQAASAANLYQQVAMAAEGRDYQQSAALVDELRSDYGRTAYAAHASLRLAALAVDIGELDEAVELLQWSVENARDAELVKLARVRLARVHVARGDSDAALAVLDGGDPGRFEPLYQEARGDALVAAGDPVAAREAYRRALDTDDERFAARPELEMKYHDLAGYED